MYKIYIIEDDFTIASLMKKHLENWGYEVKRTENFQNIISEFTEFEPHMVLVDIMLPFFNGYHWCSEIRKISDIPIIFISSASDKPYTSVGVSPENSTISPNGSPTGRVQISKCRPHSVSS